MENGFKRPLITAPNHLRLDLLEARSNLHIKRNIARILKIKAKNDIKIAPDDIVEVYMNLNGEKRRKWSRRIIVLYFYPSARIVTVPSRSGRTM